MTRRARPASAKHSEHWLRVLINDHPDLLAQHLGCTVDWQSPIAADGYAEYLDDSFLSRLHIDAKKLAVQLNDFWPASGPRWDGLGVSSAGTAYLIEAKAHIAEAVSTPSGAGGKSLMQIRKSLNDLKAFLRSNSPHDWSSLYYQYTNRLAHLYFLRELNRLDAHLVLVYFCNAPGVSYPVNEGEWKAANHLLKATLGIGQEHRLARFVKEVYIDVNALTATL